MRVHRHSNILDPHADLENQSVNFGASRRSRFQQVPGWISEIASGNWSPQQQLAQPATNTDYWGTTPTGGGGGVQTAPQPAPQYYDSIGRSFSSPGAAAAANAQIDQVRVSQSGIQSGGQVAVNTLENTYNDKVTPFVRGIETGQQNINQGRTNNALNVRRGMASIAQGVRQGLRSGGVSLANKNALDSGAADALARAYSRSGNLQSGQVRNQASLKAGEIDLQQQTLDKQKADTILSLNQFANVEADRVYNDTLNKLQVLKATADAQGLGGIVDQGIAARLVADAVRRLSDIDKRKDAQIAAAKALTPNEVQAQAAQMDVAGTDVANPFAVSGPTVDFGDGGPISQLPLYTRRKEDTTNPAGLATDTAPVVA